MNKLNPTRLWKRFAALLFDGTILLISAVLCTMMLSSMLSYSTQDQALADAYERYAQEYGVDFDRAVNEYDQLTEEEIAQIDVAYAALSADPEVMRAYEDMMRLTLIIASVGILLPFLALEFLVPLLLGKGQTLGKRIVGIGVVQKNRESITALQLMVRTIVGKYSIEIMLPVLFILMTAGGFLGIAVTLIILVLQLILIATSRDRAAIHDRVSGTVCVELTGSANQKSHADMYTPKNHRVFRGTL